MPDETKVREFLDLPGLESYDGAMKDYVDKANKTLTTAINVLEASKLDISVQQSLSDEAKALGRTNLGAASKTEFDDHTANKENPHEVTKAQVGLGNVDNTSDANKPVSTAQATAIADAKKAGDDAAAALESYKTLNDAAVKAAKDYADGLAGNYDASGSASAAEAAAKAYTDAALGTKANNSVPVYATLLASAWVGVDAPYAQELAVEGLSETQNGTISVAHTATADQREVAREAMLSVIGQADGKLTIVADGEMPELDIPVYIILLG